MLTGKLVRVRFARDRVIPCYLDTQEPQWRDLAEELLGLFRTGGERTRGQLDAEIEERFGALPQPIIHQGLAKLLEDRSAFEALPGQPPEELREAVFRAAAGQRARLGVGGQFARDQV